MIHRVAPYTATVVRHVSPATWLPRTALIMLLAAAAGVSAQEPATCTSTRQCRDLVSDAIAAEQFERAHDLAWRLFQLAGPRDTSAMATLARAQSLSGRGDDAFIMLERLTAAGGAVDDVETSDDFRRVRQHARWPQLLEALNDVRGRDASAAPPKGVKPDVPPASEEPKRAEKPAAAAPASPPPPAPPSAGAASPPTAATDEAATEVLALPATLSTPNVMAYDAVSARFIVADAESDVLRVVSEHSGNATNLVSAGWSGGSRVTGAAIDRRTGDMWVSAAGENGAVLHRMQLVSGRLLQSIPSGADTTASDETKPSSFTALAATPDGVYVLDAGAGQILLLAPKSTSWRVVAPLPDDLDVLSMAHAGSALYVSHARGLLRVDLTSRSHQPVTSAKDLDMTRLHALAWRRNTLVAIQDLAEGPRVVRLRLNARGSAVTSRTMVDSAAATAGASAGDTYYFLSRREGEKGLAFRSVPVAR